MNSTERIWATLNQYIPFILESQKDDFRSTIYLIIKKLIKHGKIKANIIELIVII